MRHPPPRSTIVAIVVLALAVLTACEAPDPAPQQIVPTNWGASLQPRDTDLLYLPGGLTGCAGGALTPDEACGGAHNLDIYPTTTGGSRGTLVWVHGGGFFAGDKYPLTYLGAIKRLTHLGWSVVSVNYRLANQPEGRFPAGVQDVAAALRWVRTNGGGYGLDTRRLVVAGYSAGGSIAALAGTTGNSGDPQFAGIPPLSGWVSLSGILDFDIGELSRYWASMWLLHPSERRVASATTWWDPADPQGWLVHGDLDDTVEYANTTAMLLSAARSGRVTRDTIDRYENGAFQPDEARGHGSPIGLNSDALVEWLAALPTLERHAHPVGNVDVVRPAGANTVRVAGWTLDPDTPEPIDVHVYVDGRFTLSAPAQSSRGDVGRAYPLHGPTHGFTLTLDGLDPGNREICVYAINAAMGTFNPQLGCRSVTVTSG